MPPSATLPNTPRQSARLRLALSLPPTPPHPDDGYHMLGLQATLPNQDGVYSQHVELCFHSDFTPRGQEPLSLHIDGGGVAVTRPTELMREPPLDGLIVKHLVNEKQNVDRKRRLESIVYMFAAAILTFSLYLFFNPSPSPIAEIPLPPLEYMLSTSMNIPIMSFYLLYNIDRNLHHEPNSF
ncbi:hypothetical protein FPCIR_11575 [Fusarium pseudocircinatum]|uniref:Uncharacterized protein n=1 Tax=Fusarium pseudocircinatum TaxID=56676 RepID=A0A8H5KS32_9HYPO|nr:hypothetical protein FPCIR_11575 [Fusarium pseudocircinatum]